MKKAKIAITLKETTVARLDALVREAVYPNRSQAIEAAVEDTLSRRDRRRLATECAKLDPTLEQALAEEGMAAEAAEWPAY